MPITKFSLKSDVITYWAITVVGLIISAITFYLAAPWMYCWRIKNLIDNSYIGERRLVFKGSGSEVFGLFILNIFLIIITFGLYIPAAKYTIEKWRISKTFFLDEVYPSSIGSLPEPVIGNVEEVTINEIDTKVEVISEDPLNESIEKDTVCFNCKSVLTLDSEDMMKPEFICPICGKENKIY